MFNPLPKMERAFVVYIKKTDGMHEIHLKMLSS